MNKQPCTSYAALNILKLRKHNELFQNDREITSTLSDLFVSAGIRSYWDGILNMTRSDVVTLKQLVEKYWSIIPEIDEAVGSPLRKQLLVRLNAVLSEIADRKKLVV